MNRLQSELHRLYLLPAAEASEGRLIDAAGSVRALVMALSGPADWEALGKVWRGVQTDLDLPAPAIAVSGMDALQLWFSLQAPVDAQRGVELLARLGARYLPGMAPARLRLLPSATSPSVHAELVPAQQAATENWSAFVAPDLAPVFADTPWLDIPPGIDGQADLLARLQSIKPAAFEAALQALQPLAAPPGAGAGSPGRAPERGAADVDPRQFLQQLLNDETLALTLRIEAAKALLRCRSGG